MRCESFKPVVVDRTHDDSGSVQRRIATSPIVGGSSATFAFRRFPHASPALTGEVRKHQALRSQKNTGGTSKVTTMAACRPNCRRQSATLPVATDTILRPFLIWINNPTLVVPHCSFFVRRLQIGGQISNNSAADCFRDRQLNSEQFHRFRGRLSPTRLEESSHEYL